MKQDRRGFLKLFGISTAAIAAAPTVAGAEPTVEVIKIDPPVPATPLPVRAFEPYFDSKHTMMMDVRDEPLWSQVRIERNEMRGDYVLFQDTPCNSSPMFPDGVTLAETNMQRPGCLPQPEMYCIQQIGFVFSPSTIPALRSAFIDRFELHLSLGRKRYWEAPLSQVFSVAEPERQEDFAELPDAGFYRLDIPLVIEAGLWFGLHLTGNPISSMRQNQSLGSLQRPARLRNPMNG
jgi:hypothetical protein